MKIVWFAHRGEYAVLDAGDSELFRSKSLVECEDYLLQRNMRVGP